MVELIYHTDESRSGGQSPLDRTIRELTAGEDVLLASPYINLDYLESILADTASWRVLTDMEAWLGSERSETRARIREFVARHHEDVHDVRDLHAKAIVAGDRAFVGSANFTRKGLAGRDELAVTLDEPELVDELRGCSANCGRLVLRLNLTTWTSSSIRRHLHRVVRIVSQQYLFLRMQQKSRLHSLKIQIRNQRQLKPLTAHVKGIETNEMYLAQMHMID